MKDLVTLVKKPAKKTGPWKRIGILAITAEGAALCYRKIVQDAAAYIDDLSHPEIFLYQVSYSDYRQAIEKAYEGNSSSMVDILVRAGEKLRDAGSDFMIIPSNTPHLVFGDFVGKEPLPVLSIIDCVLSKCKNTNYQNPLILGTYLTMQKKLYGETQLTYPSDSDQKIVHQIIRNELIKGVVKPESRKILYQMVEKYRDSHSIDSVILGCTELPMIFEELSPLPVVDSTELLAQVALFNASQI